MTTFARVQNNLLFDVHTVPGSYPDLATRDRCLPGGGFAVVPDGTLHGAKDNGDGTYKNQAAPERAPVPVWDEFDFRKRFTAEERQAILIASKVSVQVEDFLTMLSCAGRTGTRIRADDALLNEALDALADAELITPDRKAEILGRGV